MIMVLPLVTLDIVTDWILQVPVHNGTPKSHGECIHTMHSIYAIVSIFKDLQFCKYLNIFSSFKHCPHSSQLKRWYLISISQTLALSVGRAWRKQDKNGRVRQMGDGKHGKQTNK